MKKTWCIGVMNAEFIARMEEILWLYSLPYNRRRPVLCYDERPCFLIGELVEGFSMKAEAVKKEHYAYSKNGSCYLLATIEPKTGRRVADVFGQRRKVEFARHFQKVAAQFPEAEKIIVILDNLNTHHASSFYEAFEAVEARRLTEKARVSLHAKIGELAQYDRNRVFRYFASVFEPTNSKSSRIGKRSVNNCQRTK